MAAPALEAGMHETKRVRETGDKKLGGVEVPKTVQKADGAEQTAFGECGQP